MRSLYIFFIYFGHMLTIQAMETRFNNGKSINEKLINAAKKGKLDTVKALYEEGAQLNERYKNEINKDSQTCALFEAVRNKHKKVVRFLLDHGGSVNISNDKGLTALHLAVENNDIKLVRFLLNEGAYINAAQEYNYQFDECLTPLRIAQIKEFKGIETLLLEQGAFYNNKKKLNDMENRYLLNLCNAIYSKNNINVIKKSIQDCQNLNSVNNDGSYSPITCRTPLMIAAERGLLEAAKLLLEKGANINAANHGGLTALYMAGISLNIDMVKFLLDNGAFVDAWDEDNNKNLLMHLTRRPFRSEEIFGKDHKKISYEIIKVLLESSSDVNLLLGYQFDTTPLMCAVENNRIDVAEILLTTISNNDAQKIRNRYVTFKLILIRNKNFVNKDIRKVFDKLLFEIFFQERMDRATQMINLKMAARKKPGLGEKEPRKAMNSYELAQNYYKDYELATLLDIYNLDSQAKLLKIIKENLVNVFVSRFDNKNSLTPKYKK